MRLFAVLAAVALLATQTPAHADGSTPADFPDLWSDALDVQPGTYQGTLGGADRQDWLRVTHPASKGVRFSLLGPATFGFPVDDDGRLALTGPLQGGPGAWTIHGYAPSGLRIGALSATNQTANYTLTIELVDLPDLAVQDLRVHTEGRLLARPQVDWVRQVIEVDLANLGGAPAEAHLVILVTGKGAGSARIADLRLPLAPGQEQTIGVVWQGRGVGDLTVTASVTVGPPQAQGPELRAAPNAARADHHLLVPGLGTGVVLDL